MEFIKVVNSDCENVYIRASDIKKFYEYDCQLDDIDDEYGAFELIFEIEGDDYTVKKYFKTQAERDRFIDSLEGE